METCQALGVIPTEEAGAAAVMELPLKQSSDIQARFRGEREQMNTHIQDFSISVVNRMNRIHFSKFRSLQSVLICLPFGFNKSFGLND